MLDRGSTTFQTSCWTWHKHTLSLSRLIVLMWSMNPFSELIKHYRRWKHVLVKDVCDFNEMYKDSRNACFNIILSCLIPLYFIPLSDDLWTLWGKTLERSSLYIHTHKKKNQRKDLHTSKILFLKITIAFSSTSLSLCSKI